MGIYVKESQKVTAYNFNFHDAAMINMFSNVFIFFSLKPCILKSFFMLNSAEKEIYPAHKC